MGHNFMGHNYMGHNYIGHNLASLVIFVSIVMHVTKAKYISSVVIAGICADTWYLKNKEPVRECGGYTYMEP